MKNIYDIISKKKLDVVSNSIENAHGLPNECYLSGPYNKIERKKIFEDKWVVIGTASSLPNVGNAKPFNLLGIPLLIIRDKIKNIRDEKAKASIGGSMVFIEKKQMIWKGDEDESKLKKPKS